MACAAAPIVHPGTEAVLGAVDLTGPTGASESLMLALASQAARSIADRVLDRSSTVDRALMEHFVRARRRAHGPIAAINQREMITNAAAARIIDPRERSLFGSGPAQHSLPTTCGSGNCQSAQPPLPLGATRSTSVESSPEPSCTSHGRHLRRGLDPRRRRHKPPSDGRALRESELGIARLVAEGLSNREVASRLFVSPHTVDYHLRQIYRKLGIAFVALSNSLEDCSTATTM